MCVLSLIGGFLLQLSGKESPNVRKRTKRSVSAEFLEARGTVVDAPQQRFGKSRPGESDGPIVDQIQLILATREMKLEVIGDTLRYDNRASIDANNTSPIPFQCARLESLHTLGQHSIDDCEH